MKLIDSRLYTNVVLTVIATALVFLCVKETAVPVQAARVANPQLVYVINGIAEDALGNTYPPLVVKKN